MKKRKGNIFVLSSPSGCGKTTVCKRLKKGRLNIQYSVSATTRLPRKGERDGKDYIFLSRKRFRALLFKKSFLEWTDNFGDLYGTPKAFIDKAISKGRDVILAIDVKGAMRVKKMRRESVLVFLLPPSMALLKKRLKGRMTESRESREKRLKRARKELAYLKRYDYAIVNDNLARAVESLKSIIVAERNRIRN